MSDQAAVQCRGDAASITLKKHMSLLPGSVRAIRSTAAALAVESLAPEAAEVDRLATWPKRGLEAVATAGLLGLHIPKRLGGLEEGMLALVVATEALAHGCSSTALCYGMHCVATAVLAAKATPDHEERYLHAIARGEHFTSLALSEAGTGVHFYWPQTHLMRDGDVYVVNGTKQFVTSAGFADSYVVTTSSARDGSPDVGEFSALIVDNGTPGVQWHGTWEGFGMRGNASRAMRIEDARIATTQLLGREGDEVWYVFEVVAPYFLMAMSGVYLGIASAALDAVAADAQSRAHAHTGRSVAQEPVVQARIADLWVQLQQARHHIYHAAQLADVGDPAALPHLLASKIIAATVAVQVTNEAMDLAGGRAYRENGHLARLLRDARAGHVMAPPTDVLRQWLGRSVLGLPLL